MKNFLSMMAFVMPMFLGAQTAFHNFGEVKLHGDANVGFHTDFINDGNLDNNNEGLAGFYSDNDIRSISGNNRAVFNDVEIDAVNDVELYASLGVTNDLSFINGKVFTSRDNSNTSLDFINHNVYAGEDDQRHVDGYVSVTGSNNFVFPVGDDNSLRPMMLSTQGSASTFKGAYFAINPNNAPYNYDTAQKQIFLDNVSNTEFWDLEGSTETRVTLTWDNNSDINDISSNINLLRVVGWSESEGKWIDLGRTGVSGNLNAGQVTSNIFTPNNYTVITIGSEFSNGVLDNVNLIFTPNGDPTNETLIFEGLEQFSGNSLTIFNRWGNVVYEAVDYKNDWRGESTGRATINKKKDLPVGTYFYTLDIDTGDGSKTQRGWVYIHR
ncbi:gliding motility-associated C-terminal domain-containing protein [Tenacibaculum xiamenense]|uniref:gliding motility-associated C-terminal domain-containing protein n=1 Tax=Tenacibaculum xiamenense TaxID=1261553 RepID=UPI003893D4AD